MSEANFGTRMAEMRRARGDKLGGPGRKKLSDKYAKQIGAAEKTFADRLVETAELYVGTLVAIDPETCPMDGTILECPDCGYQSERRQFDHKAAAYIFDRIMGKPTARTESTLPARFVEQLTEAFVNAFIEVNELHDPTARRQAFAERLAELGRQFSEQAA